MELIHPLPKVYEADIEWGIETDSGDHLGNIVSECGAGSMTEKDLENAVKGFLGWSDQVPPATSAKKICGEAAYKKAHRGEEVILPPSRVYLHDAKWTAHNLPRSSKLRIMCRGGFYVRSLARDLGRSLGCGAHLSGLLRAAIGPWEDPGEKKQGRATGPNALPWCRSRALSEEEADHIAKGRPIQIGEIEAGQYSLPKGFPDPSAPIVAIFQSKLVALLKEHGGKLWPAANIRGGL
jgi:tRNA pseudouridine55 synthase